MEVKIRNLLHLIPIILAALFVAFMSLFALDVLMDECPYKEMLAGFFIHLRMVYILVIITLIAWRWRAVGGILYLILGIQYVLAMRDKFPFFTCLFIAGPMFLIGALFLIDKLLAWRYVSKKENRVAFWAMLMVGTLYFLSEIIIIINGGNFSLVSLAALVLMAVAAFLYNEPPKKTESENLPPEKK